MLPTDGTVPVSSVGPTFWWGGTVTDPNPQALFGQAFLEVQFYPDAMLNGCTPAGGFNVTSAPNKFTVCPMLPAFSAQNIGDALGWGIVDDTPNSFVWEIGHTSPFTNPADEFCVPGQTFCDSYDAAHWLGFSPLQIKSVTFADGSTASKWAVVSDYGGTAEVNQYCPSYGGPYCIYPWYAFNGTDSAFTYGADYPGTQFDYGQASQFATTMQCGGPFGPDSTYCDTVIKPTP